MMETAKIFKLILDAGHGFETPGKRTIDGTMREWEFNNAVALLARELFKQYQNIDVQFTHDVSGKTDVPLKNRVDYANRWGADCFVSIHGNAYGSTWNDADGIETYVYPTKPKEAVELAAKVQKQLVAITGRDNRGVKTADFQVLRETHMTAILIECGFMTNKAEAELLKTNVYRAKCASAIVDAVVAQYGLQPKPVPKPPEVPKVPQAEKAGGYIVQAGYFSNRDNAINLVKQLEAKGFNAVIVEK